MFLHESAEALIAHYSMKPHPEGGFYAEVFRSSLEIGKCGLPEEFSGCRSALTSIYFLLKGGQVSRLHRLKSDEIWFWLGGSMLSVHELRSSGRVVSTKLGPDFLKGQALQHVVARGTWFGAEPSAEPSAELFYALVGCVVAPGFDFADFELAVQDSLLAQFPSATELIVRLT